MSSGRPRLDRARVQGQRVPRDFILRRNIRTLVYYQLPSASKSTNPIVCPCPRGRAVTVFETRELFTVRVVSARRKQLNKYRPIERRVHVIVTCVTHG